jgi:HEAT repeat protein
MEEEWELDYQRAELLAEILARRGVDAGHAFLLRTGDRMLIDDYIARGPDGIRLLCRVAPDLASNAQDEVAERLAMRRNRTEPTIRQILGDRSAPAAATAAMTLGYWDDPWSVEALLAIARDWTCPADLREAALEALCRLEAPEAIEELCEAMADDRVNETTRWYCADALGAIGNAAALPALEQLARSNPSGQLGVSVKAAIKAIQQ